MKPSRTTALAALVILALGAPVAAFALDDESRDQATHQADHDAKAKHDKSAKHADKPGHATGRERADEASAAGRAHAEAMKAWARCVADAASGPKTGERTGPPKDACGDKPMGPGRAKHQSGEHPAEAPGKSKDRPRGKSDSHRSR